MAVDQIIRFLPQAAHRCCRPNY